MLSKKKPAVLLTAVLLACGVNAGAETTEMGTESSTVILFRKAIEARKVADRKAIEARKVVDRKTIEARKVVDRKDHRSKEGGGQEDHRSKEGGSCEVCFYGCKSYRG